MDCGLELKKADGPRWLFWGEEMESWGQRWWRYSVSVESWSWDEMEVVKLHVWHLSFILRYLYSICFFSFVSVNALTHSLTHSLAVSFWIVSSYTLTWAHLQILQNFYKGVAEKTQDLIWSSVPVWEQLRAALAGNHTPLQKLHSARIDFRARSGNKEQTLSIFQVSFLLPGR